MVQPLSLRTLYEPFTQTLYVEVSNSAQTSHDMPNLRRSRKLGSEVSDGWYFDLRIVLRCRHSVYDLVSGRVIHSWENEAAVSRRFLERLAHED